MEVGVRMNHFPCGIDAKQCAGMLAIANSMGGFAMQHIHLSSGLTGLRNAKTLASHS